MKGGRDLPRHLVAAAFLLTVLAVGVGTAQDGVFQSPPTSFEPASPTAGIRGGAEEIDLSAYVGRVVLVNFMSGSCPSCWAEIPGLVEVYESYRAQGLVVLGISLQTSRDRTEAMITKLAIPYPVYLDEQAQVALRSFGLRAMPTTFVFDRRGELVRRLDSSSAG